MRFIRKALITAGILCSAVPTAGQWDDRARDSLKGLNGIVVNVELGWMGPYTLDLKEREIQEDLERLLTNAGIVIKKRPVGTSDHYPTLNVSVHFMDFDIYYYHMGLFMTLRQEVSLPSNPTVRLIATTWEWGGDGGISTYPKRDQINETAAKFICDFRKANPNIKGPLPDCQNEPHFKKDPNLPRRESPRFMTASDEELIRAAALNYVQEVKSLLAKGADANAHDSGDTTALSYAVRTESRRPGDTAVAELLLNHGANPNVSVSCRLTPLLYAANRGDVKMVQLLLDHHADANAATPEGYTPLMTASMLGSPAIVSALLRKGANVNARSSDGQTALSLALANSNLIAHYDRPRSEPPYIDIPEAELLKQTQAKHAQVIEMLKVAGAR